MSLGSPRTRPPTARPLLAPRDDSQRCSIRCALEPCILPVFSAGTCGDRAPRLRPRRRTLYFRRRTWPQMQGDRLPRVRSPGRVRRTHLHDPERIVLRCRAHNQHEAEKMYGREFMTEARAKRSTPPAAQEPLFAPGGGGHAADDWPPRPLRRAARSFTRTFVKRACISICLFALAPLAALAGGVDRVRAQGELTWGGDLQGGEPFVYRDPRDPSKLEGFEVLIAEGLAKSLGVRERFVQNDWSNLLPSLVRADFDIAMNGIEDTEAVRAQALVSRPYFAFTEQLVVRRGAHFKTLADLSGHRVGTLSSSLAHAILRSHPDIDIALYGGQEEPYRDLQLGRTDAVLLDSVIAARYGLTKPDLALANSDVARGTYVIAVRKNEPDLRDA